MQKVEMVQEPARNFEEVCEYRNFFDVADYARKLSNAFSGEPIHVTLRCKEELLEPMLDRFGKGVSVYRDQPGTFTLRVPMVMSDGLLHDILNFGEGVEVLSPLDLRQKLAQTIENLHKRYQTPPENGKN